MRQSCVFYLREPNTAYLATLAHLHNTYNMDTTQKTTVTARHRRRLIQSSCNNELATFREDILKKRNIDFINEEQGESNPVATTSSAGNIVSSYENSGDDSNDDFTSNEKGLLDYSIPEIDSFYDDNLLDDNFMYSYSDSDLSNYESDDNSVIDCSLEMYHDNDYKDVEDNDSFKEIIRIWALDYKIFHNALTALLKIFNKYTGKKFPKDARTFLHTPRNLDISEIKNGQYCHIGFKNAVQQITEKLLEMNVFDTRENEIKLLMSTDGAPIGKSSALSMWPILCLPTDVHFIRVIGIFVGENKPEDSNEFLSKFVNEAVDLINNGFNYNGTNYKVHIEAVICDTPAKSFVLKTKYHTGFNSCTKCMLHGQSIDNTVCFPNEIPEPQLRTDEDFHNFKYSENYDDDYQKGETILKNISNFGLVTNVPLDYMHLVCLGAMRKLLILWLKGPKKYKLSNRKVSDISSELTVFQKHLPSDFPRKPRSLKYLKIWKATEFRNFLLYFGPVVLRKRLKNEAYEHFLMLHIAIRLLANPESIKNLNNLECANELLNKFVTFTGELYGTKYISYNIHNLKHLTTDVHKFGVLDNFSAFQFESYICSLKRLIRKGDKTLQQIGRRIFECDHNIRRSKKTSSNLQFLKKHHNRSLTINQHNYINAFKIMKRNSLFLNCDDDNNDCIMLRNGDIVRIFNFCESVENEFFVIGQKLQVVGDLYTVPFSSSLLNIKVVKEIVQPLNSWNCDNIYAKMLKIKFKNKLVVYPILHTCTQ